MKITLFNSGYPIVMEVSRLPKHYSCSNLKELLEEMNNCLGLHGKINETNYLDYFLEFEDKHELWVNSFKF